MRTIALTKNRVTVVDDCDFEFLTRWRWYIAAGKTGKYAARTEKGERAKRMVYMHLIIADRAGITEPGKQIDHKNQDALDNRRKNLRAATKSENMSNVSTRSNNTSGYKGVCLDKSRSRWLANIAVNGRQISLGRFSTPEAASAAYIEAAHKYHGAFACIPHYGWR